MAYFHLASMTSSWCWANFLDSFALNNRRLVEADSGSFSLLPNFRNFRNFREFQNFCCFEANSAVAGFWPNCLGWLEVVHFDFAEFWPNCFGRLGVGHFDFDSAPVIRNLPMRQKKVTTAKKFRPHASSFESFNWIECHKAMATLWRRNGKRQRRGNFSFFSKYIVFCSFLRNQSGNWRLLRKQWLA